MRKLLLTAIAVFSIACSYAQSEGSEDGSQVKRRSKCAKVYFDLSTGVNNNGGMLAVGGDFHVANDISLNAGLGPVSTWGMKYYLGVKCYLKPCHKGWAFGGGLTYSSGIGEYIAKMETQQASSEMVGLKLLPQANVFVAAYHHWTVGRNKNRMYLQLGWSKAVTNEKFKQFAGNPISTYSATILKFIAPGGPVVGLGFSFGA